MRRRTDFERETDTDTGLTDLEGDEGVDVRYIVPGLTRGLNLLTLFTRHKPAWSLSELAQALGVTRSAVYRIVYTLEKAGYIARDSEGRRFRLTSKVLSLGFAYLGSLGVADVAPPILRRLSEETGMSAYVAILEQWRAVYLARAVSAAWLVSNLQVGARLPAHATASGRVLLSWLDEEELRQIHAQLVEQYRTPPLPPDFETLSRQAMEDRERGYVAHGSRFDARAASCACPIRDGTGAVVAAITVISPDSQFAQLGGEEEVSRKILSAASAISAELGYRP